MNDKIKLRRGLKEFAKDADVSEAKAEKWMNEICDLEEKYSLDHRTLIKEYAKTLKPKDKEIFVKTFFIGSFHENMRLQEDKVRNLFKNLIDSI